MARLDLLCGLITVINNGVDTKRYARGCGLDLRQGWLANDSSGSDDQREPFLIGTVGRLVAAKNHLRLIDACARLMHDDELTRRYDIHLKLVGEGPERTGKPGVQHIGFLDNLL